MSFTGDLQHLPIIDVIQLLHSTRKSGTLTLRSNKGESQLGFRDGYIVSANHLNNSIRIGRILVEMNAIGQDEIDKALSEQKLAGENRKPLVAMLIESGKISKDNAFRGLETLIESTIVDILTWTEGAFSLDVDDIVLSDDYRYFPETLKQELSLDTQNVLMDALRIYDEKMRDGTLVDSFVPDEGGSDFIFQESSLSADDLGLEEIETLDKKIPEVFAAIKDHASSSIHQQKVAKQLTDLPAEERDHLFTFLSRSETAKPAERINVSSDLPQALIIVTKDDVVGHSLATVCKQEGLFVFTTDDEESVDHIIEQSITRELSPVLVVDAPDRSSSEGGEKIVSFISHKLQRYPQLPIFLLASRDDYAISLQTLQMGIRAVIPRPNKEERHGTFVKEFIQFLEAFPKYLKKSGSRPEQGLALLFKEALAELSTLKVAPEVSLVLLRFASAQFERTLTLIVGSGELVAERAIGIKAEKTTGPTSPLKFKLPFSQSSVFGDVIGSGKTYYRYSTDAAVRNDLFAEIGAPESSRILLFPIKNSGKVIALIYADFGSKPPSPVQLDYLEILGRYAEMTLENASLRKP